MTTMQMTRREMVRDLPREYKTCHNIRDMTNEEIIAAWAKYSPRARELCGCTVEMIGK